MACPTTVHDNVCVGAEVTITPDVSVIGPIKTFCLGNPAIGTCPGTPSPSCSFFVKQRICVQVPLTFAAKAEAKSTGIVCDPAGTGICPGVGCTLSAGYFTKHSTITEDLIKAAGGSILLGTGSGLSLTVDLTNYSAVLAGNAPAPPNYTNQYQQLYRQLLAADLNIQNGATCQAAVDAITAANNFLDTSPTEGKAGAPALQEALAEFNEGNAPGCPFHCSEDD